MSSEAQPRPPNVEGAQRDIRLDDAGRIDEDLNCRSCGYNLRGIAPNDHCPECGVGAHLSIRSDLLQFCQPAWVRRLGQGAMWIAIGYIASFVGRIGMTIFMVTTMSRGGPTPVSIALTILVAAGTSGIFVYGIWLLTTPESGRSAEEQPLSARRLARYCYLAVILAAPLELLGAPRGGAAFGNPFNALTTKMAVLQLSSLGLQIVSIVGVAAALIYLGHLVRRLPRRSIAIQLRINLWGLVCSMILASISTAIQTLYLFPALAAAGPPAPGGPPAAPFPASLMTGMMILGGVSCLSGLVVLVCGIWLLVLLFILTGSFRSAAEKAQIVWDHAP